MTDPASQLQEYVSAKVASGEFGSRDDFLLETARVYRALESRQAELKSLIRERIEEADQSELVPLDIDEIKAELAMELDATGQPK